MAFEWTAYLVLAQDLAERDDEASHRSAVSRAYYAAFGVAALALAGAGRLIPTDAAAHQFVWSVFKEADDGPLYYIGLDGERLRKRRRGADYDNVPSMNQESARKAVREADTIIKAIARNPVRRTVPSESSR